MIGTLIITTQHIRPCGYVRHGSYIPIGMIGLVVAYHFEGIMLNVYVLFNSEIRLVYTNEFSRVQCAT